MKNTFEEKLNMVLAKLTAFSREKYLKADIEAEFRKLQQEILTLVFDEDHALNARLTIWDAYNHLAQINEERGDVASALLHEFWLQCKTFSNLIRAEISGNKGENMTAQRLSFLHGIHKIIRNLQLSNQFGTSELDIVVFTSRAAFIVEVKNTRKDVLVDEIGDYYKVGEYTIHDCNLKVKMNFRETLLREALAKTMCQRNKDMKVVNLVVFTNKDIELHNKCNDLQTCFLAQLPYIIEEYAGEDLYTAEDIEAMAEAASLANDTQEYELEMDMQKFKKDFATLLVTLENTVETVKEEVTILEAKQGEKPQEQPAKDNRLWEVLGWVSGIAVAVGVGALASKALAKQ